MWQNAMELIVYFIIYIFFFKFNLYLGITAKFDTIKNFITNLLVYDKQKEG